MPTQHRDFERNDRLTGAIRAVLSELLLQDVNDPRLEGVVVSGVSINRDRTQARVFFSVVGDEERERQAADGFAAAASFLRREMGRRMRIRTVPTLEFTRDRSFAYGDHMERVFDRLHEGEGPTAPEPEDS
jgi:ribosome-binding factor A